MSATKRQTNQRINQLELDNAKLGLALGLWVATFGKYQSWEANKVPYAKWPAQVLKDFNKCARKTRTL